MDSERQEYRRWCDDARTYDEMLESEKTVLQAWIRLAIRPNEKSRSESSYLVKYDFGRDGFFVTAAQFNGALASAGYEAATKTDRFRLGARSSMPPIHGTYAGFALEHLLAGERAEYDGQVEKAVVERERWRAAAAEASW
jgi:hypothetical protein